MKVYSYLLLGLLIISNSCKTADKTEASTNGMTAKVSDYAGSSGSLNIMGYFVDPFMSGTIDANGVVDLKLPDSFDAITLKAFEKYNKAGDAEYELSPMAFSDLFVNLDGLKISGENATISLAGKYYGFEVFKDDYKIGTIYPTSSLEYMDGIKKPDESTGKKGYHYVLLYIDQPISIQGEQIITNYLNEDPDQAYETSITYDLELKEGWNVYKHSIEQYLSDDLGNYFPTEQEFTTARLSDINNWEFLPL